MTVHAAAMQKMSIQAQQLAPASSHAGEKVTAKKPQMTRSGYWKVFLELQPDVMHGI